MKSVVGISKESVYDPVKARGAIRVLREMLAAKGYPNAKVTIKKKRSPQHRSLLPSTSIRATGRASSISISRATSTLQDNELRNALRSRQRDRYCLAISRARTSSTCVSCNTISRKMFVHTCSRRDTFRHASASLRSWALGTNEPDFPFLNNFPLPVITSMDDTLKIVVPVTEGKVFRVGDTQGQGTRSSPNCRSWLRRPPQRPDR